MEEQDDLDTGLAKLADQATKCNILRFHNAIKVKDLLVEAARYGRSYVVQGMAFIEFAAKVINHIIDMLLMLVHNTCN
ncbi:hypothetical protein MtrunA17_Chr5g0414861 [Medicago truncatula]|uniref:Uncharacterized protein n=1 Tax=Medicago truncatula TaxID=3880 RepID=A0A396HPA5_MEDTR|nr:hypothetical protein MtrunA17_Chr5g0414861 [Medicago truncatula]